MYLGAHLSIAGGIYKIFDRAEKIDANAIQLFVTNSHNWNSKPRDPAEIEKFLELKEKQSNTKLLAHISYLVNLCSKSKSTVKKSITSFIDQLHRCNQLNIPYLVIHPGSHTGQGEQKGLKMIVDNLDVIMKENDGNCKVLLETTAGQGTSIGCRFEHLAHILEHVKNPENYGVCIDTCHIFAAGYDIRTEETYNKTFEEFDRLIGVEQIKGFHLNDSKKDFASKKDRHEHIGAGKIGKKAFELLMNDKRFSDIAMTLETPSGEMNKLALKNLKLLKGMIK